MIGSTIDKYRIVGHLGRGGAGVVYRAIDQTLQREVAIKALNPGLANTEIMARFRAEATILAKLNHPHIATIYELLRTDSDLLMVMELVRGETLEQLSDRVGPMPPERAAYLLDRILSALEHAHRAGIVHRDMKPANVMVTADGGVKIMDFGIARVRGAEQLTVDGRLMGTPAYMPPEQALGNDVDGRADLYASGVVFYRLLTAKLPFKADSAVAMMQRQILEPPLPLSVHRDDLPEWCEAMVTRALAKIPDERFQSAEQFREELRGAIGVLVTSDFAQSMSIRPPANDTLDLGGAGLSAGARSARVDAATPWNVTRGDDALSWRGRRPWATAALAVAAITAALGYVGMQPDHVAPVLIAPPPPVAVSAPLPAPLPVPIAPTVDSEAAAAMMEKRVGVAAARPPAGATAATLERVASPASPSGELDSPGVVTHAGNAATLPAEPALIFETRTLVGTKKPREHEAQLVLANGRITVTPHIESEYPFYSVPYERVLSITYSRGRDPMWNSPEGPLPVTRGGGTLGRLGIVVARDWIALRTNTEDQFVAMRFDDMLVKRVLFALQERTGRKPELIEEPTGSQ